MKKFFFVSVVVLFVGILVIVFDGVVNFVVEICGDDGVCMLYILDGVINIWINIGGQIVEIYDGIVIVDCECFEFDGVNYVVIDGDEVQFVEGCEYGYWFEFFLDYYVLVECMIGLVENLNYIVVIDFDYDFEFDYEEMFELVEEFFNMEIYFVVFEYVNFEEIYVDVMCFMEEVFVNLDEGNVCVDGCDWDEFFDEEKEEVCEELCEVCEEMCEEMCEMCEEMCDVVCEMCDVECE